MISVSTQTQVEFIIDLDVVSGVIRLTWSSFQADAEVQHLNMFISMVALSSRLYCKLYRSPSCALLPLVSLPLEENNSWKEKRSKQFSNMWRNVQVKGVMGKR